ncbi:Hypothetical predicted protein [Octopus vulgaris]|uniref:Uncharacterized protein n=1 Tax=Octopus vulgaris TaxID=6645 RepID=A0AA36F2Q8_OCTVU|nr:Hypothetical predicted protein [Octopus vulgaris]
MLSKILIHKFLGNCVLEISKGIGRRQMKRSILILGIIGMVLMSFVASAPFMPELDFENLESGGLTAEEQSRARVSQKMLQFIKKELDSEQ